VVKFEYGIDREWTVTETSAFLSYCNDYGKHCIRSISRTRIQYFEDICDWMRDLFDDQGITTRVLTLWRHWRWHKWDGNCFSWHL